MSGTNRRQFIGRMAGLGSAWVGVPVARLLAAHEHAKQATRVTPGVFKVFTAAEAADVAAIAAEIIPTDGSPGATEAHVVYFIDYVLSTDDAEDRPAYVEGLPILRAKTRELYPHAASFAALDSSARVQVLKAIEDTHFFRTVRGMTIAGFLSDPRYHGNFGGVGWKHIGFTPSFAWQPPFGDYDAEAAMDK